MRSALFVLMMAVYIIGWECTATSPDGVIGDVNQEARQNERVPSEIVVTTTTTKEAQLPPVQLENGANGEEKGDQAGDHSEDEDAVVGEVEAKNEGEEEKKKKSAEKDPPEHVPLTAAEATAVKTTTTAANSKLVPPPDALQTEQISTATDHVTSQLQQNTVKTGEQTHQTAREADVSQGNGAQHAAGHNGPKERDVSKNLPKVKGPSSTEIKTTTTTAAVQIISGPERPTVKHQSKEPKEGENSDPKVKDPEQSAIPTTTTTTALPTEKKESGAALTTTSTFAPHMSQPIALTTTSQKQSNVPKPANSNDNSSMSSLVFVFVTLFTISVMAIAPAY